MILNDSSSVIPFKYGNNSSDLKEILAEDFYPDIRDIVVIDGEYYHAKMVTNKEMLNELIGSYYSKLIGLDAVDYKIGILDGQIYALSKMFFKKELSYVYVTDYFCPSLTFSTIKRETIEKRDYFLECGNLQRLNNESAIKSILLMSAVDIKMHQADRHSYNIILRIVDGVVYIEKVFDFGWAYEVYKDKDTDVFYKNTFLIVKQDVISLGMLADRYPEFRRCSAILSDAPVYDVLREIERINNIKVTDQEFEYYVDRDEEYTKLLKKVR